MSLPGRADREVTVTPKEDEQVLIDPDCPLHEPIEQPEFEPVPEREPEYV